MAKIITPQDKIATLRQLLVKSEQQLIQALPRHIDKARMFRVYMTALQTTRGIADCEPISVLGAVFQSAQFGLSLDTILGEAFIIPRWNSKRGCFVAQFQMGYKGFIKLMRNADTDLRDVFAHVVHENDDFDWELGMKPTIKKHKPAMKNRGELVAAYAVGVWKDDYQRFEIVLGDEIEVIKQSSDSYKRAVEKGGDSPWISHEPAMWRKTAMIRFGNRMPLSGDSELAKAMTQESIDGASFMQAGGNVNTVVVPPELPTEPPTELPPASSAVDPVADTKRADAPPAPPAAAPPAPPPAPPAEPSPLDKAADEVERRMGATPPTATPAATPTTPAAAAPATNGAKPQRAQRVRRGAPPAEPPPAVPPAEPPPAEPPRTTTQADIEAHGDAVDAQLAADRAARLVPPDYPMQQQLGLKCGPERAECAGCEHHASCIWQKSSPLT